MKCYAVVLESAGTNWAAYIPDLAGCVATGATRDETARSIREAIQMHLEGMAEDNLPIPAPSSQVEYIDVEG